MPDQLPHILDGIEEIVEEEENLCANCGAESPEEDEEYNEYLGLTVCESCNDRYTFVCASCGSSHSYEYEADECCTYQCSQCGSSWDYQDEADNCCRSSATSVPALRDIEHHQITVPVIPGRPARLCSLEQELASGASTVAGLVYDEGVDADSNAVLQYHSNTGARTIHVEEDGSLPAEGGEVVYDRFNLSNGVESRRLSKIVGKIRQLRDEYGQVSTSFAAGIHVHVAVVAEDGSSLSTRDVAALYELYCYAEDMLYSFSAAGWNRHRQPADDYSGYCKAVPKVEGEATPTKVWRAMQADRYYGLNFQKLYLAVSRCSCGAARMGDWESCDCGAMNAATIEWRVFNASTLPRTLHAWLVMAHAMTAYAKSHEVGTLESNEYGSQTASEKRAVLMHLLTILPLTEGEKDLILDAAERSPGL